MFAVFFSTVMLSIQRGSWQRMVDSVVHFYFGYAQIHQQGYWNDQSIDRSLDLNTIDSLGLDEIAGVDGLVPRLESFSLASFGAQSKGVLLIGVDPDKEDALTHLRDRIVVGSFFEESGVVLARGLSEYLKADLGDSVVFISQGYHGASAVGLYPVTGIVHFPAPDLDKQLAFIKIGDAQWFYGAENRATSLVIQTRDASELVAITKALRERLDEKNFEVMSYTEMIPELLEAKAFDEAGAKVVLALLYLIIAFGIFGTLLMMMKEREYEFGILKAIGMKSRQLQLMVWLEMAMLMLIGSVAGILLSYPVIWYLTHHPIEFKGEMAEAYEKFGVEAIMPAMIDPAIFASQILVVLIMVSVLTIYPIIMIKRLRPVQAMRH
jgi:ABC-type lipoprotein release transport system permease subunit